MLCAPHTSSSVTEWLIPKPHEKLRRTGKKRRATHWLSQVSWLIAQQCCGFLRCSSLSSLSQGRAAFVVVVIAMMLLSKSTARSPWPVLKLKPRDPGEKLCTLVSTLSKGFEKGFWKKNKIRQAVMEVGKLLLHKHFPHMNEWMKKKQTSYKLWF